MKRIFIVPYRDRETDRAVLLKRIAPYLKESTTKIYFVHQRDNRPFNRGAIKNIGFMVMKALHPKDYHDMTFIFHDVDVYPSEDVSLKYDTSFGVVTHHYGYLFALGGIFAIKGRDFEMTKGFPCFWGWGFEDNVMQKRCEDQNLSIDRSQFYFVGDKKIKHRTEGFHRQLSRRDTDSYLMNGAKGNDLSLISNVKWSIDDDMIHVDTFNVNNAYHPSDFFIRDIRNGNVLSLPHPRRRRMSDIIGTKN